MNLEGHNRSSAAPADEVVLRLRALRRRGWILAGLRGLAWIGVGLTAMVTALVAALGWWGGSELRVLGWVVIAVGLAVILAFGVLLPLLRIASLDSVARRVGRSFPELASDVLSASQLARLGPRSAFSADLVDRHLEGVARRLDLTPPARVFPLRGLIYPLAALLLTIAGMGVVQTLAPGVIEIGLGSIWEDPHVPDSLVIEATARAPVVGDLSVVLRYPEYLARPARRLNDTSGGLVAPLGTTVVIEGRSLIGGVDRGAIRVPGGKTAPLAMMGGDRVTGRFVLTAPGSFSLMLGRDGEMIEGPSRSVEVEVDSAPTVRLLRPVNDVVVDESGEVTLEFEATDDHGISRVDLVLHPQNGAAVRRTVMRVADDVDRIKSKYLWAPQSLRMKEVGAMEMELEVFDNDTINGPKSGKSRVIKTQILTRLSRHAGVLEEQERTLDAMVDLLAARLEAPVPGGPRKDEEARQRFALLRSQTEDILGRTARLLHEVGLDPMTPRSVEEAFLQIREDLSAQLIHEARLHRAPMAGIKKRQGVDRVTVRLVEGAILRVDDLILDQQFSRLVADGDRLEEGRRDLARLVEGFASSRAESARRAVLDAIERMEKAVAGLGKTLEGVRGEVGDVHVNTAAVQVVDLAGALDRLRAMLAADDVDAALALAASMEEMIARLMTGLESGHRSFRTARFGEGDEFVGELLDRLMEIESDQLQLRRRTTALRRRFQEKVMEVMKGRIDPLVHRQLVRVADMRVRLQKAEAPADTPSRELLVRMRVQARELELALGQGDLDEARQVAGDMAECAEDMTGVEEALASKLTAVSKGAGALATEIDEAFPKASQIFGDRDRLEARSQAAGQRHLAARTRKLRTWIGGQGDETRFLAHQALGSLDQVARRMTEGVSHLEARDVREALEAQTEALEALERLRQDLRRGNEPAPLESRPVVLRGEVDIPDPGDYEVPAEFREDILEAMRGDLPSNYREAIERYYETLVH